MNTNSETLFGLVAIVLLAAFSGTMLGVMAGVTVLVFRLVTGGL